MMHLIHIFANAKGAELKNQLPVFILLCESSFTDKDDFDTPVLFINFCENLRAKRTERGEKQSAFRHEYRSR